MTNASRRTSPSWWVPTLYVAEGLPFVATTVAAVLMYKSLGLSDSRIAVFTSLVAWPWSLKPLWSGFMESYRTKKFFVTATQLLGGVTFGLLALSLSTDAFVAWSLVAFVLIAFNSATHDIAADGLYIEALSHADQAKYIGFASAFWNIGRLLAQGGMVYLAGLLERRQGPVAAWTIVMALLAAALIGFGLYHRRMLPAGRVVPEVKSAGEVFREFLHVATTFFRKRHVWWGLGFVLLFRFAEGQAMRIMPLFLRADRERGGLGLSTETTGIIYGTCGAVALSVGSIAGGYFAAKLPLRQALLPLCAVFNLPFLAYLYLAWTQPASLVVAAGAVVVEWFGYGFGFVAVSLFMMQQLASGRYKMSHYAIATSAMNLGIILPGMWSGWLSDTIGYRSFFLWVAASTTLPFLASWLVPFKSEAEIAAEETAQLSPDGSDTSAVPAGVPAVAERP